MSTLHRRVVLTVVAILGIPLTGAAQTGLSSGMEIARGYRVVPNVTYVTASNFEAKLDVYTPRDTTGGPVPTVIYIHGGWWIGGSKEASSLSLLPYLEQGFAAVNVEYRLARVSTAPAAVEDCRCALRWVIQNAQEYNFDTRRLVVTGGSAGGHLSLMTGMLSPSAGLDRACPGDEPLQVAAIVNWYGVTDVADVIAGPNVRSQAELWLGSAMNRDAEARRVSPVTYVKAGQPPVLTIHGDEDPAVPYSHGVRLHEALTRAGVPNQLHTVPGGRHGGFSQAETEGIYGAIFEFLRAHGVMAAPAATAASR